AGGGSRASRLGGPDRGHGRRRNGPAFVRLALIADGEKTSRFFHSRFSRGKRMRLISGPSQDGFRSRSGPSQDRLRAAQDGVKTGPGPLPLAGAFYTFLHFFTLLRGRGVGGRERGARGREQ